MIRSRLCPTTICGLLCLLAVLATRPVCAAEPAAFHPGEIWPDDKGVHINAHGGGILLHEGTYYWFGEHKVAGDAGNYAQVGVHVYSSKDLYNWKDDGIALAVAADPGSPIGKGCILERPKVVYCPKTGKFVMWFHLERKGHGYGDARSGVAQADTPTGPYHLVDTFRPDAGVWPDNVPADMKQPLNAAEKAVLHGAHISGGSAPPEAKDLLFRRDFAGGQMARDMTLFVDDDGAVYHIFASEENSTLHLSRLAEDCLKPAGRYIRIFPGGYNEAPAMFKRAGKYYLITSGCSGWAPNAARCAVAATIWGPYQPLDNPCRGTPAQNKISFDSQSTFVLPIPGKPGAFIFLADRWRPKNAIDGRYIWLPLEWDHDQPVLHWQAQWDMTAFHQ